jgi:hypothetical protein
MSQEQGEGIESYAFLLRRSAYSDDSGHSVRAKAATCRSGATLGMTYVPEWPESSEYARWESRQEIPRRE